MRCVNPFLEGGHAFGCGQCMPCRFNRRRMWMHRLMLERMCHDEASFVTLTYAEEPPELQPVDLQKWLKRFRKRILPRRVRYYAVGEYGDQSGRPHYHVALFGFPHCVGSSSRGGCTCVNCSVVRETWGFGHVQVGTLELTSARYLCGYVTKKMTSKDDPRLRGKHPEFCRMSTGGKDGMGGIGASAMWDVASAMMQFKLEGSEIPSSLRHGSKMLPLGRYLRRKLAAMVDREVSATLKEDAEVLALREVAFKHSASFQSVIRAYNAPYAAQLEGRLKLKPRNGL